MTKYNNLKQTEEKTAAVVTAKDVVKESLREVRELSKSLNTDVINNKGFQESIQNEIDRLNRLEIFNANLSIKGDKELIQNQKDSIIIFRIFQEFLSNTIKYAEANNFQVNIHYLDDKLIMTAIDDGKGFDQNKVEKGAGLINMESRAKLIKASYKLESALNQGTTLEVVYPYRNTQSIKL